MKKNTRLNTHVGLEASLRGTENLSLIWQLKTTNVWLLSWKRNFETVCECRLGGSYVQDKSGAAQDIFEATSHVCVYDQSLWGETIITLLCEGKKNIWRPCQLFFFYLPFWNFLWSVWKLPSCITWNITLAVCSSLMATSQGHTQADSRGELTTHTRRTHTHTLRGVVAAT